MDKIILNNLSFYGYHGALKEENKLGQKFFIDIELYLDVKKAAKSDDVNDSVHYGEVYEVVKKVVEYEKYNLLEALAENISKQVFNDFDMVEEIMVRVKKPEAPVNAIFDYFGVEIRRKKYE